MPDVIALLMRGKRGPLDNLFERKMMARARLKIPSFVGSISNGVKLRRRGSVRQKHPRSYSDVEDTSCKYAICWHLHGLSIGK